MKQIIVFSLLVFAAFAHSQQTDWDAFMRETTLYADVQTQTEPVEPSTVVNAGEKNLKVGFLLSAIVPGAGQAYGKSWLKAAGFFAVEVASWTLYASYNSKGRDIEDEFHAYAHEHWSEEQYFRWMSHHSGIAYSEENIEDLRDWEHKNFSHGLHREKDQQYYEMIGKYHQFNYGWDDFRAEYDITMTHDEMTRKYIVSDNREYYETRRNASNDAFKTATTGATIALVNHVLSAVDAAWTVSRYNRTVHLSLHMQPKQIDQRYYSALTLHMDW